MKMEMEVGEMDVESSDRLEISLWREGGTDAWRE